MMNRSTQSRSMRCLKFSILGAATLALFAVGCKQQEPAQEPPSGVSPPTESPAPEGQPGGAPTPGQTTPGTPAPGYVGPGMMGQGQMPHEHQMGEPPAAMTERELCTAMAQHSDIRVEDVEGGVSIVMTPKQGVDPTMLRAHGIQASYMLAPPTNQPPVGRPPAGADRCSLFDLSPYAARSGVVEQGNQVRIVLLAPSASDVPTLRSQARQFAQESSRQGQGQ